MSKLFADNLRELRTEKNLSQRELAQRMFLNDHGKEQTI